MQNRNFNIEELEDSLRIHYQDLVIDVNTTNKNARSKEEILSLLENNKKTYSCMCSQKTGIPFSYLEGMPLEEYINRNLISLAKLFELEEFKNINFESDKIEVYFKNIK